MKNKKELVKIEDSAYNSLKEGVTLLVSLYKDKLKGLATQVEIEAFAVDAISSISGSQYVYLAKEELKEAGYKDLNNVHALLGTAKMVNETAGAVAMNEFLYELKEQGLVTEDTLNDVRKIAEKAATELVAEISKTKTTKKETYH